MGILSQIQKQNITCIQISHLHYLTNKHFVLFFIDNIVQFIFTISQMKRSPNNSQLITVKQIYFQSLTNIFYSNSFQDMFLPNTNIIFFKSCQIDSSAECKTLFAYRGATGSNNTHYQISVLRGACLLLHTCHVSKSKYSHWGLQSCKRETRSF